VAKKKAGKTLAGGAAADISQVEISGPAMAIQSLLDVDGMTLVEHSERQLGPDEWTVLTYSTPGAMREAQARGCTLNILMSAAEFAKHLKKVYGQVERRKPQPKGGR
jgi:hypothetical protein